MKPTNKTEAIPQMELQHQEEDMVRLLPDDVLADVLSRLAPRGLATSRCVCAAWRAAIDGRGLLRPDLLPPRSLAGLFIQYGSDLAATSYARLFSRRLSSTPEATATATTTSYCYHRLPRRHRYSRQEFEDHCNGLLLLRDAVFNPATGRRAPLPACPPLPPAMQYFYREMYLVFDPAAAGQYEVVCIPRPPPRDAPSSDSDDDELGRRPAWPPVRRLRKVRRVGRSLLASEWPPSPYVLDVFSSATGIAMDT